MTTQTQARAEWLEQRRNYLGGTDVAAILNLHPYKTPLQVWLEKTGNAEESEPSKAMIRGLRMEPYVAELYTEETENPLKKSDISTHPRKSFLAANPDYEVPCGAWIERYVELKTHSPFIADTYGETGTDQVPHHELIQCTWQMHIKRMNAGWPDLCDLAVLFGLDDFRIYTIPYSESLGEEIEDFATRWWRDYIENSAPPAIGGSDVDTEWLKRRFPASTGTVMYANAEIEEVCLHLATARREHKRTEEAKVGLENRIKAFMGDAGILEWSGGKPFTWKSAKPTETIDYKRFYEQVMREGNPAGYLAAHMCDPQTWAGFIDSFKITKPGSRRFLTPFREE